MPPDVKYPLKGERWANISGKIRYVTGYYTVLIYNFLFFAGRELVKSYLKKIVKENP
jgi:hypothetical protein